jgi:hypothetical protein
MPPVAFLKHLLWASFAHLRHHKALYLLSMLMLRYASLADYSAQSKFLQQSIKRTCVPVRIVLLLPALIMKINAIVLKFQAKKVGQMLQKKVIVKVQLINYQYKFYYNLSHGEFETHRSRKKLSTLLQ